jgi:hypothetical protein
VEERIGSGIAFFDDIVNGTDRQNLPFGQLRFSRLLQRPSMREQNGGPKTAAF